MIGFKRGWINLRRIMNGLRFTMVTCLFYLECYDDAVVANEQAAEEVLA
jgi:hypothetical protein